jgi:transcriptional regulator with XRE-family HTH domain
MKPKQPNAVDVHVGQKIREARILNDLSQTSLAEKIGITFQQLQKYENAHNRVSCSRLYDIARVLGVPVQAFFAGVAESETMQPKSDAPEGNTLDLVSAYSHLSPTLRKSLAKTVKSLADSMGGASSDS